MATWKAPGAPGRFQLLIDGRALGTTFGTEGAEWHGQSGGTVRIGNRRVRLALHDLTGFEGCCDAVLLTTDETLVPPNHDPELAALRRKLLGYPETPEAGGEFDFVVVGGGMGPCNLWNVKETPGPVPFPRCEWALNLSGHPFPGRSQTKPNPNRLGGWYWESGFDHDPILQAEYVRDWNFRAMYGAWDALKNVDRMLPNHTLNWSAYIMGRRESRRLMGDVVLTKTDLEQGRQFPDGCVPTGWKIDLHLPDPRYEKGFEGDAFIAKAEYGTYPMPFWVPYRCLYSRSVENLFMAGRDISVTHEALGAVRVMRTGGCMGEVVGMAASLCVKYGSSPRGIYEKHFDKLQALMRRGAGKEPGANRSYENQGEPAAKRAPAPEN